MKKTLKLIIVFGLVFFMLVLTACSQKDTSESSNQKESHNHTKVTFYDTSENKDDNRTYAEKFRDDAVRTLRYPYVSMVAVDDKTKAELDAIPEKLKVYQEKFDVKLESNELNEMMLTAAVSDSKYVRYEVAGREDCPNDLLVKIAIEDPDRVVRCNALGNLLTREDFPADFLVQMAKSEYSDVRLMSLMHSNCTPEVVKLLLNDQDTEVAKQANISLSTIK